MRARNIKPSFFKNEVLGDLPMECRILFIGLWMMADKDGFLECRPKKIKAELFPYDDMDSSNVMKFLEKLCNFNPNEKLIELYYERGEEDPNPRFIQIINFRKHQSPHKNEKDSEINELLSSHESSCNFMTFHEISVPSPERCLLNDERGMMNDESHVRSPDVVSEGEGDNEEENFRESPECQLTNKLIASIRELDMQCKVPDTDSKLKKWAEPVEKLMRLDGRTYEQVEYVINWVAKHSFWKSRIRSPDKLRKKFDDLVAQIQTDSRKKVNGNGNSLGERNRKECMEWLNER